MSAYRRDFESARVKKGDKLGPAIDGGAPLPDQLWKCDEVWARLLKGKRFESLNIKPAAWTYQPDGLTEHGREIA